MIDALGQKLSVCILTYNHANLIESTVQSILNQSIKDFELIISDDCSTDGTWEIILKLAEQHPRIDPIRTPKNLGMAGNANFAVGKVRREYIALLHHDDIYRDDLLQKWTEAMDRHPDAGFAFNPYAVFNSDHVYREPLPGELIDGAWMLREILFPRWGCIVRGTAIIRRDVWCELGGIREKFGLLADIDLWMRLARRGPVVYVDEPLISVRQERPDYYPDIYTGNVWSWSRQKLLYEIHAANRIEANYSSSFSRWATWLWFRLRLSLETSKWLTYAVIRHKPEMLVAKSDSVTKFDLIPLKLYRSLLIAISKILGRVGAK